VTDIVVIRGRKIDKKQYLECPKKNPRPLPGIPKIITVIEKVEICLFKETPPTLSEGGDQLTNLIRPIDSSFPLRSNRWRAGALPQTPVPFCFDAKKEPKKIKADDALAGKLRISQPDIVIDSDISS